MNTHSLDLELSSSQYASRADTASLSQTGDISIEAWIKLEQLPSTAGSRFTIAAKFQDTPSEKRSYRFAISSTDKLEITWSADGTANNFAAWVADAALSGAGVWIHVAVTVDVSTETAVIYVNGSSVAVTKTSDVGAATSIHDNDAIFSIGNTPETTTAAFFDGLLDEIRLWSDIRTGTEITNNYQAELIGNEAGLVGYWKLNNDYNDETANNNDLSPNNSPVFSTDVPTGFESPSLSPSQSPSQSPSVSGSASASASSSASASKSLSPSSSASASGSASGSASASASASKSPSPSSSASASGSASESASASASPSPAEYTNKYSTTGNTYTDKYSSTL